MRCIYKNEYYNVSGMERIGTTTSNYPVYYVHMCKDEKRMNIVYSRDRSNILFI